MVETIGLTAGTVTAGGWRTPETRLTERYRLSADGQRLTIAYTWQDAKVYVKPHTYEIVAERTPPGQLGVRVVVRFERPQSAAVDRAAGAEQMTGQAMRRPALLLAIGLSGLSAGPSSHKAHRISAASGNCRSTAGACPPRAWRRR